MLIADGVEIIEPKDHHPAFSNILSFSKKVGVSTHVVNTYQFPQLRSSTELMRALYDSMEIPDWFGYNPAELIISHCLRPHASPVHLAIIILRNDIVEHVINDKVFIECLSRIYHGIHFSRTGRRFFTYIFVQPVLVGTQHL